MASANAVSIRAVGRLKTSNENARLTQNGCPAEEVMGDHFGWMATKKCVPSSSAWRMGPSSSGVDKQRAGKKALNFIFYVRTTRVRLYVRHLSRASKGEKGVGSTFNRGGSNLGVKWVFCPGQKGKSFFSSLRWAGRLVPFTFIASMCHAIGVLFFLLLGT